MSAAIAIRSASERDAADLAILTDIASHGFASWAWLQELGDGACDTPMEQGRRRMRDETGWGGFKDAVIAEAYGEVAGTAIGHVLGDGVSDIEPRYPALAPILALQKMVVGSWFVTTLCVYRHLRGIGIGSRLLEDQIEKADGRLVSLIASSDNEAAQSLYARHGFLEAARLEAVPLFASNKRHAWVLMARKAA